MIFIYQTCLLLIFSPSLWLVFSFSFVFCRAEVFNFNEIQWIGYFFHGSCLGVVSKNSLTYPRSSRLSSVLSSKSVIVLCFTFSFVIHFELIYVKGMRSVLRFSLTFSLFFFACVCTTVPVPLVERLSLCHCSPLSNFMWVYFWTFVVFLI